MGWTGRQAFGAVLAIGVGASLAFGKAGGTPPQAGGTPPRAGGSPPQAGGSPPLARDREPTVGLRVMTFNIQYGYRNYPRTRRPWHDRAKRPGLRRTARAIRAAKPDILAVQEISRFHVIGSCKNQSQRLKRLLRRGTKLKHIVFGDNWAAKKIDRRYKRCGRRLAGVGNAVFSRWPVVARGVRPLPRKKSPRVDRAAHRGLMWATIKTPAGRITVYNTHLASGKNTRRLRLRQAGVIMKTIERRMKKFGAPPLLLGDFNAGPRSPVVKRITSELFADAWPDPAAHRRTKRAGSKNTHRVGRIDFVFVPRGIRVQKVTQRDSRASDHRPVIAELPAGPGRGAL